MKDSDALTLLQHLYLAASQVESKAARWLLDAIQGRRPEPRDSELEGMREVLATAAQQKHDLANGIIAELSKSPLA